ncbi:MAG: hypothetical protein IJX67_07390 [Oscillospiraceae bacterium]|nr:hypothetical protein [Oscillospiraceae bacterium]
MRNKNFLRAAMITAVLAMGLGGTAYADEYPSAVFTLPEVKEKEEPTDKPVPTPTPTPKPKDSGKSKVINKKDDTKKTENKTSDSTSDHKEEDKKNDTGEQNKDTAAENSLSEASAAEVSDILQVEEPEIDTYEWKKDENGQLLLDENGDPVPVLKDGQEIPKEYERDEDGELILDENGDPVVVFTVPENSVLIESIEDVLDPNRSIDIYVNWGDQEPALGAVAEFVTVLHGYDRVEYTIQWQHSEDDENWEIIPGAEGTRYRVIATEDNYQDYWRVKVLITKVKS